MSSHTYPLVGDKHLIYRQIPLQYLIIFKERTKNWCDLMYSSDIFCFIYLLRISWWCNEILDFLSASKKQQQFHFWKTKRQFSRFNFSAQNGPKFTRKVALYQICCIVIDFTDKRTYFYRVDLNRTRNRALKSWPILLYSI